MDSGTTSDSQGFRDLCTEALPRKPVHAHWSPLQQRNEGEDEHLRALSTVVLLPSGYIPCSATTNEERRRFSFVGKNPESSAILDIFGGHILAGFASITGGQERNCRQREVRRF